MAGCACRGRANSKQKPSGSRSRQPGFARALRQAETAELVARDYVSAVGHYRAAIAAARQAAQRTYAQLLLARALARAGRRDREPARV